MQPGEVIYVSVANVQSSSSATATIDAFWASKLFSTLYISMFVYVDSSGWVCKNTAQIRTC